MKTQRHIAQSSLNHNLSRDAKTGDLVCSSKAEGIGSTEADDIVQAIKRALQGIFTNAQSYFK